MRTIVSMFEESARIFADNIYVYQKENDAFRGFSYREVNKRVHHFAAGLMQLGLMPGDRVSLLAEGRLDWITGELGVLYNGAINVPLSIKLTPEEILFRVNHSGSKYIITTSRQLDKILKVMFQFEGLEKIILLDLVEEHTNAMLFVDDIVLSGEKYLENNSEKFSKRFSAIKDDDFANICYTSGTTADPKGIILSHRNYTANVEQAGSVVPVPEWYSTLLILPWDHAFAHTCGIYTLMKHGASLACVDLGSTPMDTLKNIPINIKETQPVFLMSVPALAKNFRKNIEKAIRQKGPKVEKLFNKALDLAYDYNGIGWDKGKGLKIFMWPFYKLYDKILFSKIRENFGGKLEFFIGGGALLDIELQRFFYAIGIPMYQGYGLSEASPVISSNCPNKHKLGSSGILVKKLELKICDTDGNELPKGEKGEIVVKGENVMKGYWRNEEATRETIKDGWLFTGDLGYIDEDNFLYVLGRFKSLLIADDGEKFSPEGIEEAMTDQSPLIEQCMLQNNQKPYTVCLLVPNVEALKRKVSELNLDITHESGIISLLKLIEKELNQYRTGGKYDDMFPQRWLPSSVALLNEGFTEENKLMNSTLKIVRPKITEKYAELIDYLYTPESKDIANEQNIENLRVLLKGN
jgi:long-chain acyl-CoA synthetase